MVIDYSRGSTGAPMSPCRPSAVDRICRASVGLGTLTVTNQAESSRSLSGETAWEAARAAGMP
jgi:hypothetical protein